MNEMPVISVIMSVYNEPINWLVASIESILKQSFNKFEFIIINDNPSRVENSELLESFRIKDKRIVLINNEENIGLTKSLNKGFKISRGKYIARMDADDISLEDRFLKQYQFLEVNTNIVACGTCVKTFGNKEFVWKMETITSDLDNNFLLMSPLATPICHPSAFIKAKILKDNNIKYNEDLKYAQDFDLWYNLMKYGKLSNLPECLLLYRLSGGQVSSKNVDEQKHIAASIRRKYIVDFFEDNNISMIIDKDITLESIRSLKQEFSNIKINKNNRKETSILIAYYLSLQKYDISSFLYFLFSFDFFNSNFSFKNFLRVIIKHINKSRWYNLL